MKYVWKGPPTAVEIVEEHSTEEGAAKVLFSGTVAPGREIPADLPEHHSQVRSWLAFALIEAAPDAGKPTQKMKEPANG